jgi:hypothetical protein
MATVDYDYSQQLLAKSGAGHCNNGLKAKLGGGFSRTL